MLKKPFTRRLTAFLSIFSIIIVFLCGFVFTAPAPLALDPGNAAVYKNVSADTLILAFSSDRASAKAAYDGLYIALTGEISYISSDYKELILKPGDSSVTRTVRCISTDAGITAAVEKLSVGDRVKVYGKFSSSLWGNDYSLTMDKIVKNTQLEVSDTSYSLIDGTAIDTAEMPARTLGNEKIRYYIPDEWTQVEYSLKEEGLGILEGYQYRLNELPSSPSVSPESLFVCYFDNDTHLKILSDKSRTDAIERAILANILGKKESDLEKFPLRKVTTYYGAKYQYYQDIFRYAPSGVCRTEFVFEQVGGSGILLYLYVYETGNHAADILTLMRLLSVSR